MSAITVPCNILRFASSFVFDIPLTYEISIFSSNTPTNERCTSGIYKRTSQDKLTAMSNTLHQHLTKRSKNDIASPSNNNLTTGAVTNEFDIVNDNSSVTPAMHLQVANDIASTSNTHPSTVDLPPASAPESKNMSDDAWFNALDFKALDEMCAKYDSTAKTVFQPKFASCSNVTFNINFHK